MVIFAMACVTGFAVAVAASGWWDVPVTHVLWLGLAWTVVICIIDRLIYKSFGTNRITNLVLAIPRAALSVMLALVLGLPMVQFIFQPSISKQLTQTNALEQKMYDTQKGKAINATLILARCGDGNFVRIGFFVTAPEDITRRYDDLMNAVARSISTAPVPKAEDRQTK